MKHTSLGTLLILFLVLPMLIQCRSSVETSKVEVNKLESYPNRALGLSKLDVATLYLPAAKRANLPAPIKAFLALRSVEQVQGLSGLKSTDLFDQEGMLFIGKEQLWRGFWMPDTHFDLDIYFLDRDLKILAKEIGVKHYPYPASQNPHLIPRTQQYQSYHVLELKTGSKISAQLEVGDSLVWGSNPDLQEILKDTRLSQ